MGKANLLAGRVWETGLGQPDNALLRYREAAALLPAQAEPFYLLARAAEAVGRTLGGHLHEPMGGDDIGNLSAQAGRGDPLELQRRDGIVEVHEVEPATLDKFGDVGTKELCVERAREGGPDQGQAV